MLSPRFELFEAICNELRSDDHRVITETILSPESMEDLKAEYGMPTDHAAINRALGDLRVHFKSKGAKLPFRFNPTTGEFWALDREFINFVSGARSIRGAGRVSKQFEEEACKRLTTRLTGELHSVGWPRKRRKTNKEFTQYMKQLGFDKNVLDPKDKDGGFDIMWLPPLGAIPLRPIVSLQCKNSSFDRDEAFKSEVQAVRSIGRHSHMRATGTYVCCMVFNDYIDTRFEGKAAGWPFVPLGLSDLAKLSEPVKTVFL